MPDVYAPITAKRRHRKPERPEAAPVDVRRARRGRSSDWTCGVCGGPYYWALAGEVTGACRLRQGGDHEYLLCRLHRLPICWTHTAALHAEARSRPAWDPIGWAVDTEMRSRQGHAADD